LRERGHVEGQNIVIEIRSAIGRIERFPALASDLVRVKVDVIVALNSISTRAAQKATTTIPIVGIMGDPVGEGLVASLARPGGNLTGLSLLAPELVPKLLALLKEALPAAARVAALLHPRTYSGPMMKDMESAASALGLHLRLIAVHGPDELDRAFSTISGDRADALIVLPSPMLYNERRRIADFATRYRLPTMAHHRDFPKLGGLISFGVSIIDLIRRAAGHVDKVLKGAKPGDLPVEQPTKFELVINLKTARALGLAVPEALLVGADEIIE
jgi:putative ABC transport system substrate-binding protein